MTENIWCQKSDEVLKYLYEVLKIFDWSLISKQLAERLQFYVDSNQCRQRYIKKYGIATRNQWIPEQEKQLYRLHNQNGNKWAIISQNLLGRSDNCVKNHFYSKLRKSLRTINKICKLYLKKESKQVGEVVIYKLTQVTDQSLKQSPDVPDHIIKMSFDLKNRLLQYDKDHRDIKQNLNYNLQKQILSDLNQFNKLYKKKPKKQKISMLGAFNLQKRKQKTKNSGASKQNELQKSNNHSQSIQQDLKQQKQKIWEKEQKNTTKVQKQKIKNSQNLVQSYQSYNNLQSIYNCRSESQYSIVSIPKRTVNYLIKPPPVQTGNIEQNRKSGENRVLSGQKIQDLNATLPLIKIPAENQNKIKTKVEDILMHQGVLQNGLYGSGNDGFFRRQRSSRSFSICSDSSNPDMFGEDILFAANFRQLSEMENESQSQIFGVRQLQ